MMNASVGDWAEKKTKAAADDEARPRRVDRAEKEDGEKNRGRRGKANFKGRRRR